VVAPKHELGAYLLVGINLVPNPDGLGAMNLLGFGIKYDRIEGGFFMSDFDETIERRLIFPNVFALDYRHGGGFISYDLLSPNDYLTVSGHAIFQRGDMVWRRVDTGEDFLRATFNLYQFGFKVESPVLRYVRPGISLGYQGISDFQLTGVSKEDFSGLFIGFTVKIGYFNQ
ncbi:MAG: hypothetical protein AAF696_39300, partial [Bacteroidota bacterium]